MNLTSLLPYLLAKVSVDCCNVLSRILVLTFFHEFVRHFRTPRTIGPDAMAVEAMQKMESPPSPVQFLPVIDQQNILIGIITLHGLVSAGL